VVTVKGVSSRSEYVHLRVEPSERKGWQEAAERSGRSLSAMIREALEVELERCDHVQAEQVSAPSVSPQAQPARARAEAADVFTEDVAFQVMQSIRLDLGYGSQVHA